MWSTMGGKSLTKHFVVDNGNRGVILSLRQLIYRRRFRAEYETILIDQVKHNVRYLPKYPQNSI